MCNKAILENGRVLESVPDCYKNQQMCDKPHALKFFPNCCKSPKMYDKVVNTYPSLIKVVPECYKTQ